MADETHSKTCWDNVEPVDTDPVNSGRVVLKPNGGPFLDEPDIKRRDSSYIIWAGNDDVKPS